MKPSMALLEEFLLLITTVTFGFSAGSFRGGENSGFVCGLKF